MPFRTFVDSAGREWEAYDVIPPADERRQYDRRSDAETITEDRRTDGDRRLTVGRVSALMAASPQGWLCFEHRQDRRRLSPIPDEWAQATDRELEKYLESARAAPALHVSAADGSGDG